MGRVSDQLRGLNVFMEATKDLRSVAYSLGGGAGVVVVVEGFEGWALLLVLLTADSRVVLGAAAFLGLPLPFKLPSPLGKSLNGTTAAGVVVGVISSMTLTGEDGSELFGREAAGVEAGELEEEEEDESFRVSFSFLGPEAAAEEESDITRSVLFR